MHKDSFSEAFLCANANPQFIASEFAEVIRNLVRAFAASDASRPIYYAAEKMDFVAELLQRCKDHVSWYSLFTDAIAEIHQCMPDERMGRGYVSAAQDGTKYLVEASATDNAAAARSSRRLHEFLRTAEWALEPRRGR
jgi:hypothetical protein